jgi:(heptosyl)LPS beta-1,4-glucosyltransferase
VGSLAGDLLHLSYPNLRAHLERIPDYARRAAQARLARGVRGRLWRLLILPLARGLRAYVWRAGFLDGVPGLVIAVLSGCGVFAREALLWEASRGASMEPTPTGDTRPQP